MNRCVPPWDTGRVSAVFCNDAATLAQKLANNVRSLRLLEQFVQQDEQTDEAIHNWIGRE